MDLIDRADVLETFSELYDVFEDNKAIHKKLNKVYDKLRALPAVQPQPVVRCKDCKHWMRENVSDGYCSEMNIGDCDEDFYCGYAVRKDNR